ncbi:hypothetical protein P4284_10565 [Bacillus swezeyi]|nr:hypothetical protein [Bacillus swezeyi]
MEKAMHKSHGMGYQEYSRSHENRLEVEKRREEHYQKGKQIVTDMKLMNG